MAIPPKSESRVRFGGFELDLGTRELWSGGQGLILQEQPFQILATLLERPGHLVTREELRRRLWSSDTFVDFERSLNKAVNRLREVLADSPDQPRFIETLPRQGYRFIAAVELLRDASDLQTRDIAKAPDALTQRHRKLAFAILGVGVAIVLTTFLAFRTGSWRHPTTIRSIAVLPLENLSGDPSQDYFADGMTDQLITDLGQIGALRVISRTSVTRYKKTQKTLPEIARELNVDAVLEGAVLRAGNQVRITAQLIQAVSDRHLWAHTYEGNLNDVLTLQNRVAADIAEEVRIKLTLQEQALFKRTRIANPAAYEAYLKGRYSWDARTSEGMRQAINYFGDAIREDPNFPLPYAGLAEVYASLPDYVAIPSRESYGKARVAATRALQLDDTLAEAHTALGIIAVVNDYDWSASEREYRRAIELNPGYAGAYHQRAINLMVMSRSEEAIAEIERARQLDPMSIIINANVGFVYYYARRLDDAIPADRKALELDSNSAVAYEYLGLVYLEKKMYREAVANLSKAVNLSGGTSQFVAELSFAYAADGNRAEARKILTSLQGRSRHEYVPSFNLAVVYAGLGDRNRAVSYLEKAYDERCSTVPLIKVSPLFESLHSDPRFQILLRRVGFPS